MQITREDLPDRQVALILDFEPEEIEPALQKTYQRLVGKVNIPGFRPGKAPRRIFERYVGREALIQEASESLLATAVKDALERENLTGASANDVQIETTEPLRVRVLLDQEPLVELGEYADIRVSRDPVEVTAADVDAVIDQLRRRDAQWHDPEEPRPARLGDRVTIDIETFTIDGPVEQMTGSGQTLELSDKTGPSWPREIDENLVGMQVGEEKDFAITFPAGYTDEKLQGKEATVHVKVTALQEADLPELNDEFAERYGSVPTMDELRTKTEADLQTEAEAAARSRQARAVLDTLQERSRVEVSSALIDSEVDHRYERLTAELQRRHIAPARYFTYEGTSEKAWRAAQREPARTALRNMLVVQELAEREGVAVSDADVEAQLDAMLAPYADNPQLEQLRSLFDTPEQREQMYNRLFDQRLTARLVAIAESGSGADAAASGTDVATAGGADAAAVDATATSGAAAAEGDATAATSDAASAQPAAFAAPSGAVPATEQEPGPLEVAGGAAEVLGTGTEIDTGTPADHAAAGPAGAEQ